MAHLHKALSPYSRDPKVLAQSAKIYSRGKTPEVNRSGAITELDVKPGGPDLAARHVRELHRSGGPSGMLDALRGLQITRGNQFVGQMFHHDAGMKDLIQPRTTPASVQTALESNETGRPIPSEQRDQFTRATGHDPSGVRLYDNPAAHDAATAVGARAFTVGERIFFNRGEYNPAGQSGNELLMHELAHTVQQKGSVMPEARKLEVSTPGDVHERQAENVAQTVSRNTREAAASDGVETEGQVASQDGVQPGSLATARIQRAITFTTADHDPTTNAVAANETAAGFQLQSADPTFQWQPDVTIHGNAGDVFADWETAHHQVAKGFWENVWWGHGGAGGHRQVTINGGLPMRDATAAANTWYSDFRAQGFTADGDVRSPIMHDRPRTAVIPWDTPVAGKAGNTGTFNYGFGFVSTLSARHIPDGTGAGAFRHLNHMHWNFGLDGTFDAALALGGRVNVTGGAVNHSKMFSGFDPALPPMHGGAVVNDNFHTTDN
jgi:hypothetical protein